MRDRVPSGRGEFKPMEIQPATFEVGSPFRKIGEEVTRLYIHQVQWQRHSPKCLYRGLLFQVYALQMHLLSEIKREGLEAIMPMKPDFRLQ